MRKAAVCAVLAAIAVAGCSSSQSSSALRLSPGAASPSAPSSAGGESAAATASASPMASLSAGASGSPGASAASTGSTASAGATSTAAPTPSASYSATVKTTAGGGNITIGPADGMVPGPMTITPLYCGKFSASQRSQFGTTAAGGLIYQYANHSGITAAAKLYVGFTEGGTTAGSDYAANPASIASGQSAEGEVDALGIDGQGVSFTGCELMSYALVSSSGTDPVSYAG